MSAPFNPPGLDGVDPPPPPPDRDNWLGAPPNSRRESLAVIGLCALAAVASVVGVTAWALLLGACR